MHFENVDYELALLYLLIVGGRDHLVEAGLKRLVPRWLGKRPDLLTIASEALIEHDKWAKRKVAITEKEKLIIISRVVEAAVYCCGREE